MSAPRSDGELAIAALLKAGHGLPPDEVAPTVGRTLTSLGMTDPALYLVDLAQRFLMPIGDEPASTTGPLDIDASVPGTTFRTLRILEEPVADGAGVRLWLPMMDGADRVGVLGVTVAEPDETTVERALNVASIAAGLVVAKSTYGDHLVLARRRRDTDLAAEMRWSMLPPLTFTSDRVAIAGMLEPAYEIAGDAFDYAINGDVAHVAILDAMGHGLLASRMANVAVGCYRHSRRHGLDLIETFAAIDAVVGTEFGSERFVTGQLARLDLATGRLQWVNAGHPRPMLLRPGQPIEDLVADTSLPLGLGAVPAEVAEVSLEPGDAILFFTDGVVEARSPEGDLFGRPRLRRLWAEVSASGEVAPEIMRKLCHSVLEHQRGRLQDDATLLLVAWTGPVAG